MYLSMEDPLRVTQKVRHDILGVFEGLDKSIELMLSRSQQ